MEVKQKLFYNSLKRYWRRRSYQRLDHNKAKTSRKKIKSVKFTTLRSTSRRFWRIKAVPKLRFKIGSSAIHKLWSKFKNAYMQMMINFSGKMWYSDNGNVFGDQRNIHKVGQVRWGRWAKVIELGLDKTTPLRQISYGLQVDKAVADKGCGLSESGYKNQVDSEIGREVLPAQGVSGSGSDGQEIETMIEHILTVDRG
ncbi:hypothetical protein LWI28_011923 [Acer negundo]|uniref:Uncharacterized protein n=1 Tax=Acer negundo TaxID=4023 RepID=A0AAD5IEH8_ACENE|nr:hypothetical protein LWI28_011923 [Acer negundo]